MQPDVIIVGCGVAGLHAAYVLVDAGMQVRMLDAGETPKKKFGLRYPLLGRRASFASLRSEGEKVIIESFVAGGLSEIWGGVCERFTDEELEATGLPALGKEYDIVSKRIRLKEKELSTYHGHTTLKELRTRPNFEYRRERVHELPTAPYVIIACGAVNTAELLQKKAVFYKGNTFTFCFSKRKIPLKGLRPAEWFSVGSSYVILYSILPGFVIADVRGPVVDLLSLGLYPFFSKTFREGSTSHYAGGVKVDKNGKYSEGVYVADSAGWLALPAKPIALTIMANANRIGAHIAELLEKNSKM